MNDHPTAFHLAVKRDLQIRPSILLTLLFILGCSREARIGTYENAPVILISIDTLRADRLPVYGYKGVATPSIDRLRADGILFTSAWAQAPLTLPSHVSLMTGELPTRHGVRNNIGYRFDGDPVRTLPGLLKSRGYATGAAVSSFVLRSSTGLGALFDFYDDAIAMRKGVAAGALSRSGDRTREVAQRWIDKQGDGPFLLFLHLFEPHAPYTPPEPFASRYANAYDGEVAEADRIVGAFLEHLRSRGIYDRAIIILLADHGEGLGDHGEPEHGVFLYRETIHVPLIVKLPRATNAGQVIAHPVGLIDVLPTVAELIGSSTPNAMDGLSLFTSGADSPSRRIYSETFYPRIHLGWSELRSLVDNQFHFIDAPRPELFSLRDDPAEKNDLIRDERRVFASMKSELAEFGTALNDPGKVAPEEAKKLAALGYLGSVAPERNGPLPDPKDRIGVIADMTSAMSSVSLGRHAEALPSLRSIVEREPAMTDAWNQLALSLEALGRYEEAADSYKKAISLTPALAGEFGLSLGSILLKIHRYDEAMAHARLAETLNPSGYHLLLGHIEFARKDFSAAEREARAAMNEPDGRLAGSVLLAQIYGQQGRVQEGLDLIEATARDAGQHQLGPVESLEFAKGDLLARVGKYTEAESAFRQEIDHFPANDNAYASLAIVYRMRNDTKSMREIIEAMVAVAPSNRRYTLAARTLEELGDVDGAVYWKKKITTTK